MFYYKTIYFYGKTIDSKTILNKTVFNSLAAHSLVKQVLK